MKFRFKLQPYRGAGLLLSWRSPEGVRYVVLGKRRINPHRGSWSISGGKCDSGDADYRATALREFREELTLSPEVTIRPEDLQPVFTRFFGVFNWRTFAYELSGTVRPELGRGRDNEFSELAWFPVDNLPEPLHWGVRQAVSRMR